MKFYLLSLLKKMQLNLPFNKIHDPRFSYGRLLLPTLKRDRWGNIRWLGIFKGKIKRTDYHGFHNCTTTGVY